MHTLEGSEMKSVQFTGANTNSSHKTCSCTNGRLFNWLVGFGSGFMFLKLRDPESAVTDMKAALALDSTNIPAHNYLVRASPHTRIWMLHLVDTHRGPQKYNEDKKIARTNDQTEFNIRVILNGETEV